jgi:hypothetical protein
MLTKATDTYLVSNRKWWISVQAEAAAISPPQAQCALRLRWRRARTPAWAERRRLWMETAVTRLFYP